MRITLIGILVSSFLWVSCSSSHKVSQNTSNSAPSYDLDKNVAIDRLSQGLQYQTVSLEDTSEIDFEAYDNFIAFLDENYPNVHENIERERISQYSLLYKWEGANTGLKPAMMIGHYDVVPVKYGDDTLWQYAPFAGEVAEGFVWGRGALDDKGGVMSIMEALEYLTEQGFEPERTFYIALHHDEEVGGVRGAQQIAEHLEEQNIELAYLVDEGLPIAEEIIENVEVPLAMIGVASKGSVNIELRYSQDGGHSSMPTRTSVIGTLSNAVNRIERKPMRASYSGLIVETFEPLIPYMTFTQRLAFNNTWLFKGIIKNKLSNNPATNAALRTTAAKTIFEAGFKENVLPVDGRVIINFRIHPNDTVEDVEQYVRSRIKNSNIDVRVMDRARNPSPVSSTRAVPYQMLKQTIEGAFNQVLVAPSLFIAASDARHFHGLTSNIYRFRPIRARHEDRSRVHGIDERISVENYMEMIRFQIRLIENGAAEL
ncbi:M20/M25/M40 family metallo-hydrolase [Fodinibius sp. AD559]|uniref:M20/M25/M40 family metallo-hydrolase n=1 Tax=Fodinibius sp. AD559 TaxID=3424179 RepID=UPI0040469B1C